MDKALLEEIKENKELVAKINNITILYYDAKITPVDKLQEQLVQLQKALGTMVIALPKQFDVMLDCSIDQLMQLRTLIDTTIAVKAERDNEIHQLMHCKPNIFTS